MFDEFKISNTSLNTFLEVVKTCEGPVRMTTTDNDQLNLKSQLSFLVGMAKSLNNPEIDSVVVRCDNDADRTRILQFMLYGRK
jgi:hypothetical protein